ncbi:MAG TPA: DUF4129 domain-containing protein [Mycobacteriales bacterium]|nr:DUF4129 domain-containing protein [Mycobacteriales bacterium]
MRFLAELLLDPHGPITRDGARDAAHHEVSRGVYHADQPGLLRQVAERVAAWFGHLFDRAAGVAPGGGAGVVAILVLFGGLLVLLLWRSGPLGRAGRRRSLDDVDGRRLDAADHRRAADGHTAAGRYAEAVRERMRAIARELEARGVLEVRPGRTADEVAAEAGGQVPALAEGLRRAARVFDEVWYGGRRATAQSDAMLREVDQQVHRTPLRVDPARPTGPVAAR